MIEYKIEQRSREWHQLRGRMPTASNFSKIITSTGTVSSQIDNYIDEMNGIKPKKDILTQAMQNGILYEKTALDAVADKCWIDIEKTGFVTNNSQTAGCSPDGVIRHTITDDIVAGVEVKSVVKSVFDKYNQSNKIPSIYYPQVMGSMAICDVDKWYFGAYDYENEKLFSVIVGRDERWIKRFWDLIEFFNSKLTGKGQ